VQAKAEDNREKMNSSLKGACLSGLVYPGLGQIVQKHYFRGICLIGICTTSLLWVLLTVSREVGTILAKIESGSTDDDISSILRETTKLSGGGDNAAMGISSVLILSCWVIGIVDAYVSGKKIDSKNAHNQAL
jgi:hypothetical protein